MADVTILILPSRCDGCGKVGHNYLADRDCFDLLCEECLDAGVPCSCAEDEHYDDD